MHALKKIFSKLVRKISSLSMVWEKIKDIITRHWNRSWRKCSYEDFRIRHFVTYFNSYKMILPLSCVWTLRYEKELKPGQFYSGQVAFLIRLPEKLMETTFLLYKPFSLVHCTHNLFLLTLCPHSASANCIPAVKYDVIKYVCF